MDDNEVYDALFDAARTLEESIPRTTKVYQRTALASAVKALDLLAVAVLAAGERDQENPGAG